MGRMASSKDSLIIKTEEDVLIFKPERFMGLISKIKNMHSNCNNKNNSSSSKRRSNRKSGKHHRNRRRRNNNNKNNKGVKNGCDFQFEFSVFGFLSHHCLGSKLAINQCKLIIYHLLRNFVIEHVNKNANENANINENENSNNNEREEYVDNSNTFMAYMQKSYVIAMRPRIFKDKDKDKDENEDNDCKKQADMVRVTDKMLT